MGLKLQRLTLNERQLLEINTPDIREATVAKRHIIYKAIWHTFKIRGGYLNWLSWSNVANFSVEIKFERALTSKSKQRKRNLSLGAYVLHIR